MSVETIQPELFVELSTEQQQLLSGGQFRPNVQGQPGGFPGGGGGDITIAGNRPDITVRGFLTDSNGQSFPVRIFGFREDF